MRPDIPPFHEGIHWRRLTDDERNGREWKYVTLRPITVNFGQLICFGHYQLIADGEKWGFITPHNIEVAAGYAWNGSSFSPDLKGVMLASLVHDLLYQFSGVHHFPFTRQWCDNLFFDLSTTPLAWAYRAGLFLGSWSCWGQHAPGTAIVS